MARLVALIFVNLLFTTAASPVYAAPATFKDFEHVLENIVTLLTPAAAVAFLVMLVVGAFKFITSGGDQKGTAAARSTLTYAMLGVMLVAGSILIIRVIQELTGTTLTEIQIPTTP